MEIRTFLNVSHIKRKDNGIRVVDSLLLVIRLVIIHHGMTFVIVLLPVTTVAVQLSFPFFDNL